MFSKAFRLFVSSTFQDFGEERRLLQERVFPALEAHCAKEGFGFRAVDMRWGVNGDAQLNQRTAEICLGEVIEAKGYPAPNLLVLIGDRYGWTPLPFAIARDEFQALRAWLITQNEREAVADFDRVYTLDENHLVPGGLTTSSADRIGAYTLRSREDELIELRAAEDWAPVEARLLEALQAASRQLHTSGRLRDVELEKYELSLTEQEIRKGLENLAASDGQAAANSIAWVRTTVAAEPPVRSLADAVQRALPNGNVLRTEFQASSESYGDHFVAQITARLRAAIDAQIADFKTRALAPDFALHTERAIHAAFAAERLRVFVGRDSNLAAIIAHIASDARHPLVLTGISGSGKTALMAKAAAAAPGAVVQRFVGATASSASQRNLLISVIEDLAALGVTALPEQWEDDDHRFVNQVRDILVALDQPVAIFIDALDQLRAPYRPMWLPPQLQPQVKLIVSVLDDEKFPAERNIAQGLRRNLPTEALLAIEPLGENDGAGILAGLKRQARRGLSPEQEAFILERFRAAGASPLYLRIAFAIACRWRSGDDPRARVLGGDVIALIGQFLDELSSVHHHEPLLVRRALGLIAAGREGLSESEAIAVLSRDAEVMAAVSSERFGATTDRLPDSVWVRLKGSLSALLVEKGEEGEPLISFFHRQVAEVVRARFYEPEKVALHTALAAYFNPPAELSDADPPWTRRGFSELPFQLFHAGMRERLDLLLTDPAWIDLKVRSFAGAREIVQDYQRFAKDGDRLQTLICRTLGLCSSILARDPKQAAPQLHGRLLSAGVPRPFLADLVDRIPKGALYETRPALTPATGAEVARIEGHVGRVNALIVLPDGCLASGSEDRTVRIWNLATGDEIGRLEGHKDSVNALAVLTDGCLASGSSDATVRIWDWKSGAEVDCLEGHEHWVYSIALLPDGCLASGSSDRSIRLWDLSTRTEAGRLDGHRDAVLALTVLPDGRLASGSKDWCIRLWDVASRHESACLGGRAGEVNTLAMLPDGRLAAGYHHWSIRLWDLERGEETNRLDGHARPVTALAVLPDGRLASTGSFGIRGDRSIKLWDVATGEESFSLKGHAGDDYALVLLPDGRLACGSDDGTITLWDLSAEHVSVAQHAHGDVVTALASLPDGYVASASNDGTIRIWNVGLQQESICLAVDGGWVNAIAVLGDGRLASAHDDGIRLWDVKTGREAGRLEGHSGGVTALTVLPDGRLASGAHDHSIRLWDVASGRECARLDGHGGVVKQLLVLPDGRLASRSDDKTVRLWDTITVQETAKFEGHKDFLRALVILPDGRLATASGDQTIKLWDAETGQESARLEGHSGRVEALIVLPDGRLASGAWDKTIRLWDVATGLESARLEGHGSWIAELALLPGGQLASLSGDKTLRVWNIRTATECARLDNDVDFVELAILSDDLIVVGDRLGRLHWLAIKGGATPAAPLPSSIAAPPPPILGAPATIHRSDHPLPPRTSAGAWPLFILLAAITSAFAAAILLGPTYGFPQAREVWDAALGALRATSR